MKASLSYVMKFYTRCGIFLLILVPGLGWAQDTHYWTQQFGTHAALLSGSSVAASDDNSVVYYNPAAMSFLDSTSISVNGTVYKGNFKDFEGGAGTGLDMKSNYFQTLPLIISGIIHFKKQPRVNLGYGVLQKVSSTFTATARKDDIRNIIDDAESPGNEEFIGQYTLSNALSEQLFVVSGSYRFSDRFAVGIASLMGYRAQVYNSVLSARIVPNGNIGIISNNETYYLKYSSLRLYEKISAQYEAGPWAAAITVTLPSFRLGGTGIISADLNPNNINVTGAGRFSYLANDRQEKLPATFKNPWSLNAGFAFFADNTNFYVSAEYFGSVPEYDVMTPRPGFFVRPASEDQQAAVEQLLEVKDIHKAITNFAIGAEHSFSPALMGYVSMRTDFSYANDERKSESIGIYPVVIDWNVYHVNTGVLVKRKSFDVSIGLQYSWGSSHDTVQFMNFDNPDERNFLHGYLHDIQATYRSFGLIVGYSHRF